MTTRPTDDLWALTEREKQTLRLIVRGHDAKSIARTLNLSIHTINERLRDARRKMAVSSSREAARLLLAAEGDAALPPDHRGVRRIVDDAAQTSWQAGVGPASRRPIFRFRTYGMPLALGIVAVLAAAHAVQAPPPATVVAASDVSEVARRWLTLLDEGRWADSYHGFGRAFRTLNTQQVWSDASTRVRKPLGAVVSRTLLSRESVPAPPAGYELVKFRTRFANTAEMIETVTLEREDDAWRVVGVTVG